MQLSGQVLTGWRKTGVIFLVLMWGLTLVLLVLLVTSLRLNGSWSDTAIFVGNCSQSDRNVLLLRTGINVLATAILTSSNFFLQLLTAPVREDIDKAHDRSKWLEVGVNSLRNLRFITWPKLTIWLLIALLSIPFHLIFNSSVYGTDSGTELIVALASEEFTQDGRISLPGIGWALSDFAWDYIAPEQGSEEFLQEIDYIAQSASSWQRLDGPDCFAAYDTATLRDRRHLVVVLETDIRGDSLGWNFTGTQSVLMESQYYVSNNSNPLYTLWDAQNSTSTASESCCNSYFGQTGLLAPNSPWNFQWPVPQDSNLEVLEVLLQTLTAKYCLSEQIQGFCKTQVSNVLFLVVFLCCLGKSVFATVTVVYLWHSQPISTVGDAIQSFIRNPDVNTEGMCTFGWQDFRKKTNWTATIRKWKSNKTRCAKAVPLGYWLVVYIFSFIVLATAFVLFGVDVAVGYWSAPYGVNSSDPATDTTDNQFNTIISGIVGASIISNLPQLVLSILYLLFTGLVSRMVQSKEWALMSVSYQPLRVTKPRGQQVSSWLLQAPLLYAIPLQIIGIALHILASNSLYVYVLDVHSYYHLAPPTYVITRDISMDFSPKAELTAICAFLVALVIPVVISLTRLPGPSVVVGNSSAAISAACHVTWSPDEGSSMPRPSHEYQMEIADTALQQDADYPMVPWSEERAYLQREIERRVQGKLKWGVVAEKVMSLQNDHGQLESVGHLSFGTEEDEVGKAVDGALYAVHKRNFSQ